MEPNIGSEETLGEPTGEKMGISEFRCTLITWESKLIAHGENQFLPIDSNGPKKNKIYI